MFALSLEMVNNRCCVYNNGVPSPPYCLAIIIPGIEETRIVDAELSSHPIKVALEGWQ